MIVVAGPPGGGKSCLFPVSGFGVPYFNADDRAAELNGGSCDRPILDLLHIDGDTPLDIGTDGKRLVVAPGLRW